MSIDFRNTRLAMLLLPALLAACGGSGHDGDAGFTDAAVIATRTASYDSGAVSLVASAAPFTALNGLPPSDTADIFVRSGGDHYFVIQRYGANRVLRYDAASPGAPVWTYSSDDPDEAPAQSNPSDLLIVSDTKAYLLRYGSGTLWVVDPSASSEAGFKKAEIDLSHYDVDGVPETTAGLLKDGKLYIALQRLENFAANKGSYIAVIDTASDTEVRTGASDAALKGIELPMRNISGLAAIPGSSKILAFAPGDYGSFPDYVPAYDGGIAAVDTNGYAVSVVIDDGDGDAHPYGQIGAVATVTGDRAYFIGSTGFAADQTLYRFDPGAVTPTPVAVSGFGPLALGALAVDPSGRLWVGRTDSSAPGVAILGFANGTETTVKERVDTQLIPINIDFVTVPAP